MSRQFVSRFSDNGLVRHVYLDWVWFPSTMTLLKEALIDCSYVLDVGCGNNSFMRDVNYPMEIVGIDLFTPYLMQSKSRKIHDDYLKADINKIEFKEKSFDAILLLGNV